MHEILRNNALDIDTTACTTVKAVITACMVVQVVLTV